MRMRCATMRCNEMCGMQLWPRYLEPREWVGLVERWQVWLWCSCSDRGRSGGWRAGGPNPQAAVAEQSVHSMHSKYVHCTNCRMPADPTLKMQSHCMQSRVYTAGTALIARKVQAVQCRWTQPSFLKLHSAASGNALKVQCTVHTTRGSTLHNTQWTLYCTHSVYNAIRRRPQLQQCSQHHVGNMTACKH